MRQDIRYRIRVRVSAASAVLDAPRPVIIVQILKVIKPNFLAILRELFAIIEI